MKDEVKETEKVEEMYTTTAYDRLVKMAYSEALRIGYEVLRFEGLNDGEKEKYKIHRYISIIFKDILSRYKGDFINAFLNQE